MDKIIAAADKLCELCPVKAKCKEKLGSFIKEVFAKLDDVVKDPLKLCQELHLCSASSSKEVLRAVMQHVFTGMMTKEQKIHSMFLPGPVIVQEKPATGAPAKCIMCEFAMTELERFLGSDNSEVKIKGALESLCPRLPQTVGIECKKFINGYWDAIFQFLVQEIKPRQICTHVNVCHGGVDVHIKAALKMMNVLTLASNESCETCMNVAKEIQKALSDQSTRKEIEAIMDMVCSYTGEFKKECTAAVDAYLPLLLDFITGQDPKAICTELGMCASVKASRPKCYYGPSYWCANKTNAKLCKVEAFCKKYGRID